MLVIDLINLILSLIIILAGILVMVKISSEIVRALLPFIIVFFLYLIWEKTIHEETKHKEVSIRF